MNNTEVIERLRKLEETLRTLSRALKTLIEIREELMMTLEMLNKGAKKDWVMWIAYMIDMIDSIGNP